MSRHRNFLKDEDYGDYDDDYYEEEDYEDEEYYEGEQNTAVSTGNFSLAASLSSTASATTTNGGVEDNYVQFVIESLGGMQVSEQRVKQLLSAYDNNVDKTISYFIQQSEQAATPTKAPSSSTATAAKDKAISVAASSNPTAGTQKTGGGGGVGVAVKMKSVPAKAPPAISKQQKQEVQDLDCMGFETEAASQQAIDEKAESGNMIDSSATLALNSALRTSSALLSDDEFEAPPPVPAPSSSPRSAAAEAAETAAAAVAPQHLTMVVAGHVDAGNEKPLHEIFNCMLCYSQFFSFF